jgi:uncharacterized protein
MQKENAERVVAVLGASPNPERYAFLAMRMLLDAGYVAEPVNPAFGEVLSRPCRARLADVPGPIDTVTVYLGSPRSDPLIDEIIAARPARLLLNPGAENPRLEARAREAGIEVVHGCTLVMLSSNQF